MEFHSDDDFRQPPNIHSITSIGNCQIVEELDVSKDSFRLKKIPSSNLMESSFSDKRREQVVTSIEFKDNDIEKFERKKSIHVEESVDLDFINKVKFDREKYFRIHFMIEKPENQLIEETLQHFEKKFESNTDAKSHRKKTKNSASKQQCLSKRTDQKSIEETESLAKVSVSKSILSKCKKSNLNEGQNNFGIEKQEFHLKLSNISKDVVIRERMSSNSGSNILRPNLKLISDKSFLKSQTKLKNQSNSLKNNTFFNTKNERSNYDKLEPLFSIDKNDDKRLNREFMREFIQNNDLSTSIQTELQKDIFLDDKKNTEKLAENCQCELILSKFKNLDIRLVDGTLDQLLCCVSDLTTKFESLKKKYECLELENMSFRQHISKNSYKKDLQILTCKNSLGMSFLNDQLEKNFGHKKSTTTAIPQSSKFISRPVIKLSNQRNSHNKSILQRPSENKHQVIADPENDFTNRDSTHRKPSILASKKKSFFNKIVKKQFDHQIDNTSTFSGVLKPKINSLKNNVSSKVKEEKPLFHLRG